MRPLRRNTSFTLAILAAFVFILSSFSPSVFAQSEPQLSPTLSNAVRALANKIAAAAGTTQSLSMEVKNISSLSPSDATAARQALEAELTQRHFRLAPQTSPSPPDATPQVRVTFSEGVGGFVWVAEIRPGNAPGNERQVAIVAVSKPMSNLSRVPQASLTLDKKLIWEQPDMFVDFATLPQSGGASSTLLILEPSRLAFYRSSFGKADSQWQLWQTVAMAHSSTQTRDVIGRIDIAGQKISLPGFECAGDLQQPQSVKCAAANRQSLGGKMEIPGHEGAETAALALNCGEGNVLLATGNGDWTQPDSIQGFEVTNLQGQPIASGEPIAMDGPVISFAPSPNESNARAVVYNLKTNHYEGYVVTATCNR